MRFVRCIEDAKGDLVELVYYCSALCFEAEDAPELRELPGGAWPWLDSDLDSIEPCAVCGASLGTGEAAEPDGPFTMSVTAVNFCEELHRGAS